MSMTTIIATSAIGLMLAFFVVWLWQLRSTNAGMIDPVWAASLAAVAVFAGLAGTGAALNRIAVAVGGGFWGLRLAIHLWHRNAGQPEDARYRQFRNAWGPSASRRFFWFFQLQALVALLLCAAFFVPASSHQTTSLVCVVTATVIWLIAVAGEAIADHQLARFCAIEENRDRVCQDGLWRYSRHPNYFFECLHWVAYTALSVPLPLGWLTVMPPILMGVLLMKVSGIPLLEARLAKTRRGYNEYVETTSALVPWPPRRQHSRPTKQSNL